MVYSWITFRMESDDDSDIPDTIVPASSPESQFGDDTSRFPHLLELKEEEENGAISPVIPMIPRSAIPSMLYDNVLFIGVSKTSLFSYQHMNVATNIFTTMSRFSRN